MNPPLWMDLREGGAGTWEHTNSPDSSLRSLVLPLIVLLVAGVLFIDLLVAGRAFMCATHDNDIQYCPGYAAQVTP